MSGAAAAFMVMKQQQEERENLKYKFEFSHTKKDAKQLALEQQQAIIDDLEEYERLNDIYKKIDWENI